MTAHRFLQILYIKYFEMSQIMYAHFIFLILVHQFFD
jgi:hypothetical protein